MTLALPVRVQTGDVKKKKKTHNNILLSKELKNPRSSKNLHYSMAVGARKKNCRSPR